MGKRVHVAKRYEVEHGSTESFNWKSEAFFHVLTMLGAEPVTLVDADACIDVFECPVKDYGDALQNLQVHIESPEVYDADHNGELLEAIRECDHTPESLLKVMQAYYDEADKRDGWLHFMSF